MKYLIILLTFTSCISFNETAITYKPGDEIEPGIWTEVGIVHSHFVTISFDRYIPKYGAYTVIVYDGKTRYQPIMTNIIGEPILFIDQIGLINFMSEVGYYYTGVEFFTARKEIYSVWTFIKR